MSHLSLSLFCPVNLVRPTSLTQGDLSSLDLFSPLSLKKKKTCRSPPRAPSRTSPGRAPTPTPTASSSPSPSRPPAPSAAGSSGATPGGRKGLGRTSRIGSPAPSTSPRAGRRRPCEASSRRTGGPWPPRRCWCRARAPRTTSRRMPAAPLRGRRRRGGGATVGWWAELKAHPHNPAWILSKSRRPECHGRGPGGVRAGGGARSTCLRRGTTVRFFQVFSFFFLKAFPFSFLLFPSQPNPNP